MIAAHAGTTGLVLEIATAVAVGALLLWAAIKSRRSDHEEGDR
jgi:hypothetical protein